MEKEINKKQKMLDMMEETIVKYVQVFFLTIGMKITKEEAENIVSNVGMNILNKEWQREDSKQ